jgi:FixJ family two-component response regulator
VGAVEGEAVIRLYQLTQAEQEVSELLMQNHSVPAIARMRGVSFETVRQKATIKDKHESLKLAALDAQTRPRVYVEPEIETWKPWK